MDGTYKPTGQVAPQRWIPTTATHEASTKLFVAAASGEDPRFANDAVVPESTGPGEGGSLRRPGLPGLGLMGQPTYFFRADPQGVLDKLNREVMHTQVAIATRLTLLMDRLTPDQLRGKRRSPIRTCR